MITRKNSKFRTFVCLIAAPFAFAANSQVSAESAILIDFGSEATPASGNYNNWTTSEIVMPDTVLSDLIDASGANTGISLRITSSFWGANSNGLFEGNSEFDGEATRDSFYSGDSFPTPSFDISGLDPAKMYSFTIYAMRDNVSDVRSGIYTVTGQSSASGEYNASNSAAENYLELSDVKPTAEGIITFDMVKAPSNTNGSGYFYLGAMKIEASGSADLTWAGFPVDGNGNSDTGEFLGWVNVQQAPWIWAWNLGSWVYVPEPDADSSGVWAYILSAL